MADEKKKPVEPGKEERSQLKKLMESHIAVLEHRLGHPPTMDDLQQFLNEAPQATENVGGAPEKLEKPVEPKEGESPSEEGPHPAILDMKIFYGMSGDGENRKPDQNKILFYRTPDNRWYDTNAQTWLDTAPSHAEHLPSRDINFNEKDIVSAIAHGVMGDQDYDALDKAGMITDLPRQLWSKVQQLHGLKEQLEKSVPLEQEDSSIEYRSDDDIDPGVSLGADVPKEFLKTAGVDGSTNESDGDIGPGEDLIAQIMEAAMSAVDERLEEQVYAIVQRCLAEYGLISPMEETEDGAVTFLNKAKNLMSGTDNEDLTETVGLE